MRNDNLRRGRKRLKLLKRNYDQGKISLDKVKQSVQSWEAHLKHGNTYQLRQNIDKSWLFS